MAASTNAERVRAEAVRRLTAFLADPAAVELRFEPLGDRGNYIVVEEAGEFPGLVDCEEGEMMDERHVVVYKAATLPKDVAKRLGFYVPTAEEKEALALQAAAEAAAHARQEAAHAAARLASAPTVARLAASDDIYQAETRKQDRRTVGEILRATEDAKRARGASALPSAR
jgi:hypothetical protein